MLNKRNLILGLLVFAIGVMLTACGGSGGGGAAATNKKDIPDEWEDAKCRECTRTYKGKFRPVDDGLFLEAIGVEGTGVLGWGNTDTLWGRVFNNFADDFIAPTTNLVYCVGIGALLEYVADKLEADDENISCSRDSADIFSNTNDDRVKSSYNGWIKVTYEDYEAEKIEMFVDANIEREDFREVFYYEGGRDYENSEGTMRVLNTGGRVRLMDRGGRVIGEFRD